MSVLLQQRNNHDYIRYPWTTKEVVILRRLYQKGIPQHKIAQRLRRTPDSVHKALTRFEIRKKTKKVIQTKLFVCSVCKARRYVPINANMEDIGHAR